ncbi:MAG: hypothetical protein ACTH2Q_16185 [Propionibacteriaceae bacterium]
MSDGSFEVEVESMRSYANSEVQAMIEKSRAAGSRLSSAGGATETPMLIKDVGPKVDDAVLQLQDAIQELVGSEERHQELIQASADAYDRTEQANAEAADFRGEV